MRAINIQETIDVFLFYYNITILYMTVRHTICHIQKTRKLQYITSIICIMPLYALCIKNAKNKVILRNYKIEIFQLHKILRLIKKQLK